MFCCVFSFAQINVDAAVKSSIKNGICTVSGTGKMTQKYECNQKIKKVVIKKGVTYIPKSAFCGCKNLKSVSIANTVKSIDDYAFANTGLKTITVPKSVKKIGYLSLGSNLKKIKMPGKCKGIRIDDFCDDDFFENVKSVEFTTPLDLSTLYYIQCRKVITSSDDPKYKSIDGVVYSKDGTILYGIPRGIKKLTISSKCTNIKFSAFEYNSGDYDYYPDMPLEVISFPKTFFTFEYDEEVTAEKIDLSKLKTMNIPENGFGKDNVNFIFKHFVMNETILNSLSENDYIYYTNGFLIGDSSGIACSSSDAHVLYGYFGDKEEVIIPDCIETISDFHGYEDDDTIVKKVILGSNVKEIKSFAFIGDEDVDKGLEETVLNEGLTKIGEFAFSDTKLKRIVLPETVETIGQGAFEGTMIEEVCIPHNLSIFEGAFRKMTYLKKAFISDGIEYIPGYVFAGCSSLEEITIPNTVNSIEYSAFNGCDKLDVSKVYAYVDENKKRLGN